MCAQDPPESDIHILLIYVSSSAHRRKFKPVQELNSGPMQYQCSVFVFHQHLLAGIPEWELEARGLSPCQLARRACQDPVISKTVHIDLSSKRE